MEIIGRGFIARNLLRISGRHADAVALAAGVSNTSCRSEDEYQREAALVYRTIERCHAIGRKLLFFSTASASMYGALTSPGFEDGPVYPPTTYGRHKLAMEAVIKASGVDFLILRLAYVIGAHQRGHQLLPSLVTQLRSGSVTVHRGAHRDVIAADDVVTIVDDLLTKAVAGTVVNIGSGFPVPAEKIVAHLEYRLGTAAARQWIDHPTEYQISLTRLNTLVPRIAELGFGPDYYRQVLDHYLDLYPQA
ncbi:NAD-dependent epimerase/dehydratase family protein [Saccharopolyspora pogona]|uniref:NAD-dependent epimerase/dehydratase family protein n=1 Tax=Saccharopolyspora pogona TaxID=333966 RepID=UPI0000053468|nr:NAD-dependent epimerase/dehydratase family protein [Saccharopolyspora pogona]